MAPEVIKSGVSREYASAADIWSFGITLFELLKGRPPLHYLSPSAAMGMIPSTSPPRLESSDPHASKLLQNLLHACLHDDPRHRPTATQLLKQFKNYFKAHRSDNANLLNFQKQRQKTEKSPEKSNVNPGDLIPPPALQMSTVLSQWDFEVGSSVYEVFNPETADQEEQEFVESNTNNIAPKTPLYEQLKTPKGPFHKRPLTTTVPKLQLRSLGSISQGTTSIQSGTINSLKSFTSASGSVDSHSNWTQKDPEILPIPAPLDCPDLSQPQYQIARPERLEDGILRLMRRYLTEEDNRPELSLQLQSKLTQSQLE